MDSVFFVITSPIHVWHPSRIRFLAQPKREANHGIDMVFVLQLLDIPGTPVGSGFWRPECSEAKTEEKSWIRYVFVIKI